MLPVRREGVKKPPAERLLHKNNGCPEPTHHARAGEHIPAQADAIAILHLAPLLLQSFVVHLDDGGVGSSSNSSVRCTAVNLSSPEGMGV